MRKYLLINAVVLTAVAAVYGVLLWEQPDAPQQHFSYTPLRIPVSLVDYHLCYDPPGFWLGECFSVDAEGVPTYYNQAPALGSIYFISPRRAHKNWEDIMPARQEG